MTYRIDINKDMLTWAILRAGFNLAAYMHKHPIEASWISGDKQPTVRQLEEFAARVHVPYGYLFLPEPPHEEIPIPMFRGEAGGRSFNLNVYDTVLSVKRRQDWLADYLKENEYETCKCVGIITLLTPIGEAVNVMRSLLCIDEKWAFERKSPSDAVNYLTERIESLGISVSFNSGVESNNKREIPVEDCRGFVLVDDVVPFIFVNNKDSKTAQLFTLAHEMAHVLLGKSAGYGGDLDRIHDITERFCDNVAAAFLVPAELLREEWNGIEKTARRFRVSDLMMARRAHNLGIIRDAEYRAFYLEYRNRPLPPKNKSGFGDFYATALKRVGHLFAVHVNNAVNNRKLDYLQAYRLTGMYGNTYNTFIKKNL